jgi:NitT/TauT family transport system ATP-binding protein
LNRETIVEVDAVEKIFNAGRTTIRALERVTFAHREGEFLVVIGPSGCGKTTLVRLVAGLLAPDRGRVRHRGQPAHGPAPWISVVFQEYNRSLFPWLTVAGNVAFGPRRLPGPERERRVDQALRAVGLQEFGDYSPWQLSGGMQQRVALARALAAQPQLLLMDEPFASVDAQTRMGLEDLVMDIWQRARFAALLVTHDVDEAVLMADRVLILSRRPARVIREMMIPLPRPRDQLKTREHPDFLALRHEIFDLVRSSAFLRRAPEHDGHRPPVGFRSGSAAAADKTR